MKEKKKELSDFKIKLIIMAVFTIAIAIAVPFIVKIVNNIIAQTQSPTDPTPPDEPPVVPPKTPTLTVPTSITIDKLTTNHKFEYTVTDLGEYQVSVTILDTSIASLDTNNYIIPSAVGSCIIVTEINCEPKITKTTTLTICDAVTDITYKIIDENNQEPEQLFVGKTYTLEVCENGNINDPPNLGYLAEYISDFTFVNKTDNTSTYIFKIIKAGDFNFYYNGKYCKKYINLTSYIFPTEINVSFSNITIEDNCANLYLFNNTYAQQANADGYFDETIFEVFIADYVYDEIDYEIAGSSILLNDNKITAVKQGKSSIIFTSSVSGISKIFEFNVIIIEPNSITLNSSNYNIGDQAELNLKVNTQSDFIIDFAPIYAYGKLSIDTSDNITILDNKITLTCAETGNAVIKFNDIIILTCIVNYISEYKVDISLGLHTNQISFSNDTLNIVLGDNNIFVLNCKVKNTTTNQYEDINLNVDILDTNIVSGTTSNEYIEIKNGTLTLIALNKGSTKLVFSNDTLNIYYELKIEISE